MANEDLIARMFTTNELVTDGAPLMFFGKEGGGPFFHVCPGTEPISEWLDRQRLLGLISPEGAAAVERLIGDLG